MDGIVTTPCIMNQKSERKGSVAIMKNIKEAEAESGINKQNIRYYEKMCLLRPDRITINGYRKYSEEDIRRLKFIYLF